MSTDPTDAVPTLAQAQEAIRKQLQAAREGTEALPQIARDEIASMADFDAAVTDRIRRLLPAEPEA